MPTFDNYPDSNLIKMLYLGDSGAGKTGSLCSLAAIGLNVRILDLDRGAEVIKDFVTNPSSIYVKGNPPIWTAEQAKGVASRISYVTITETVQNIKGSPVPKADSWAKLNNQLDNWVDGETKLGNISTWGDSDVLVIDSLSKLAMAAWNFQLAMNGRLTTRPEQSDYYNAQNYIERFLVLLQSPDVKCHVIIICHLDYIERDDGITRAYPRTVGKALSPKIGENFNHTLLAKTTGQGALAKRKILTNTIGMIDLKNTAPLRVAGEYDLSTGLAEYFKATRGR